MVMVVKVVIVVIMVEKVEIDTFMKYPLPRFMFDSPCNLRYTVHVIIRTAIRQ